MSGTTRSKTNIWTACRRELNVTIPADSWIIGKLARRNWFCAEERLCQGNLLERDPFSTENRFCNFR
jgi:hypothetical protein